MNNIIVSVIMPVYNTGKYLKQSIDSILNQSFKNFEFIIINDASTDNSEKIILEYKDPRIIYLKNETNLGISKSLNKAIALASGKFIARMDGDDISLPERLKIQLNYITEIESNTILSSRCELINENGEKIGKWHLEYNTVSQSEILSKLPQENCIVHASVFARRDIFLENQYRTENIKVEDYDLWLRLASKGFAFHKTQEPLLLHRIHTSSFTRNYKMNPFYKNFKSKIQFIAYEFSEKRINLFIIKTMWYSLVDFIKASFKAIYRL